MVEQEVGVALPQQPGRKEKSSLLERLRAIQADVEVHTSALTRLNEKSTELYEKTGDQTFSEAQKSEFNTQFTNITAVIKVRNFIIWSTYRCLFLLGFGMADYSMCYRVKYSRWKKWSKNTSSMWSPCVTSTTGSRLLKKNSSAGPTCPETARLFRGSSQKSE